MPNRRKRAYRHKKKSRVNRVKLGLLLICLGVILLLFPVTYKNFTSTTPRPTGSIRIDQKLLGNRQSAQPPVRIMIPALKMDLPVVEANVVSGYWELSETSASHGVGSANPTEMGNMVIFAHARDGLFGPLRNIAKNDLVYILTKSRWERYRVTKTQLVSPDQTEVIAPTKDETLTLYTCSGFLDSKRLIVTAKPVRP